MHCGAIEDMPFAFSQFPPKLHFSLQRFSRKKEKKMKKDGRIRSPYSYFLRFRS